MCRIKTFGFLSPCLDFFFFLMTSLSRKPIVMCATPDGFVLGRLNGGRCFDPSSLSVFPGFLRRCQRQRRSNGTLRDENTTAVVRVRSQNRMKRRARFSGRGTLQIRAPTVRSRARPPRTRLAERAPTASRRRARGARCLLDPATLTKNRVGGKDGRISFSVCNYRFLSTLPYLATILTPCTRTVSGAHITSYGRFAGFRTCRGARPICGNGRE